MVEKNGEIQSERNERIRKATQFCHSVKSILWNKYIDCRYKTTIYNVYFK
jgi:hypothetical protein